MIDPCAATIQIDEAMALSWEKLYNVSSLDNLNKYRTGVRLMQNGQVLSSEENAITSQSSDSGGGSQRGSNVADRIGYTSRGYLPLCMLLVIKTYRGEE